MIFADVPFNQIQKEDWVKRFIHVSAYYGKLQARLAFGKDHDFSMRYFGGRARNAVGRTDADKPFLDYLIHRAARIGFSDIVLLVAPG